MSMTLYALPLALERVLASETEEGEPIDVAEQQRRIQEFLSEGTDSVERAIEYVHHLQMEADECSKIIAKFQAKKKAREATIERIKDEVLMVVDQVFAGKFESLEFPAHGRNNRSFPVEVVEGADLSKWEASFVKVAADTAAIRAAYKEGKPLPEGAKCFEKTSRSLVLK